VTDHRLAIFAACAGLGAGSAHAAQPQAALPGAEFVFEEIVTLGPAIAVGQTPRGHRTIIPITGGTFKGPKIAGTILPGGWDWQLTRPDSCTEVKADYMLRTDDGVVINIVNTGVLCAPPPGGEGRPARTHPRFEAPLGKYEWLNKSAFIGTLDVITTPEGPAVKIGIYEAR
jgi:hypothetical protein